MKKTFTINLNSIVFNIDDDAYEALNKYLQDIASHFSSDEDKKEIMADIEARIAELFGERMQQFKEVITIEDVSEIIAIMGNPNQFSENETETEKQTIYSNQEKFKKRQKRFYRDPENAVLGGVCSGLAAYFNIDVTVVRIIIVILTIFLTGFTIPAYLLAWIIAPPAVTVSQRLEMQGEDVTIENIKAEFGKFKNYVESEDFRSATQNVGQRLGEVFGWFFKIIFGFVAAVLIFSGIIIFMALIFALFVPTAAISGLIPAFILNWAVFTPGVNILLAVSLLFVIGCPIFMLIYGFARLLSGNKSKSSTSFGIMFALWLVGISMLAGTIILNTDYILPWIQQLFNP
jgi:phage shock protein PspC (stress-responsive transcriptional regulator)